MEIPSGAELRRRWRALAERDRRRLARLSGTGEHPATLEEALLITGRSRRFRRYLVGALALRAVGALAAVGVAIATGRALWLLAVPILAAMSVLDLVGLPRVLREERANRRVVEEMRVAADAGQ